MTEKKRSMHDNLSMAVAVTEEIVIAASRASKLEQLRVWARQGWCVTIAGPLCAAAEVGSLEVYDMPGARAWRRCQPV
jgi:hypothetical protein